MRIRIIPAVLVVLLATACGQSGPEPTSTTSTSTTLAPPSASTGAQAEVIDVLALASHPNGAQMRVSRIEIFDDAVLVYGGIVNGSPFGLVISRGLTELRSSDGRTAALIEPVESTPIGAGDDFEFILRFQPLPDAEAVTLVVNAGAGSSPTNPNSNAPWFELGPLALDVDATRVALPEPVPVRRSTVGATGVELQLEGIVFTETRIGAWVRISNPGTVLASISPTIAPSVIVDDLGNRYPLILPEGAGSIDIPAGTARSGVLSFGGRIHPDAATLSMGLNAGQRGDTGTRTVVYPQLVVEDISLAGQATAAALPDAIQADATIPHPNGVEVGLGRLSFGATESQAELVISNPGDRAVALAGAPTVLIDDLGNAYPLVPPAGNSGLVVEAGTSLEGTFVFSGRIDDRATLVRLVVNAGESTTDPGTLLPSMEFGPFELTRSDDIAEPVEARVFAVGPRSRLVDDILADSQVDRITQTLEQFGASEVDGGFSLTLPDAILFDFGSRDLRPDAAQALTLVAEVLRYFEGDAVIVVGHTDSIGSEAFNQRLSEQRAEGVAAALVGDHDIPSERLTAEGRGASEPVAANTNPDGSDNPEGRQLNRRVEIVVLTDRPLPGS
ncbi:MAG: OmpA family protein [Acidimicrobiia bacterium]|jgi:outer membrane protein OmpA-like peptidoglycan-associated protein